MDNVNTEKDVFINLDSVIEKLKDGGTVRILYGGQWIVMPDKKSESHYIPMNSTFIIKFF